MPRFSPSPLEECIVDIPNTPPQSDEELFSDFSGEAYSESTLSVSDTTALNERARPRTISITSLRNIASLQIRQDPEDSSFFKRLLQAMKNKLKRWQKKLTQEEEYEPSTSSFTLYPRSRDSFDHSFDHVICSCGECRYCFDRLLAEQRQLAANLAIHTRNQQRDLTTAWSTAYDALEQRYSELQAEIDYLREQEEGYFEPAHPVFTNASTATSIR